MMRRLLTTMLVLLLAPQSQARTEVNPPLLLPNGAALTEAVRAADAKLFTLFFTGCDPEQLSSMVTETLEFYHDKGGLTASSGPDFVGQYAKSRRELVTESLQVDPVPGFGAMEVGEHLFYERRGDGPERLVGRAGFAMVWQWTDGIWKLHRVLSFGHKAVQ
jgi:Domain of unknown function (DUF4440)